MNTFKKGLSITLVVLFVISALAALLAFNLERTAFDAETYQKAFAKQQFYDQLPGILAKALTGSNAPGSLPPAMQGLNTLQWENFIRNLLPPEALQTMGDATLASLFDYINGSAETVQIPLTPLKQSMSSDVGVQAVLTMLHAQPDCTLEQVARLTVAALTEGQIALCNLPEDVYPLVTPVIQRQLQWTAEALPEQLTLLGGPENSRIQNLRQRLQSLRLVMRLSPLLPLAFLFALTLLAVRSLHDWLAWWGGPFLATGLAALLSALAGAPMLGAILLKVVENRLSALFTPAMLDQARPLVLAILGQLVEPLKLQGGILAGLGLLMTLGALALRRKTNETT
ncbi:MAG: hypothetical protein Fur0043_22300 [Anaerolineales bacterium]